VPPSTSLTKWKKLEQLEKSSANEEYEVEDIISFQWNHNVSKSLTSVIYADASGNRGYQSG
jgi:hypothetical protein